MGVVPRMINAVGNGIVMTSRQLYHLAFGTAKDYNQVNRNHFISGTAKNYNQGNNMGLSPYSTMNDTLLLADYLLASCKKDYKSTPDACHALDPKDALTHQVYAALDKAEQKGWG